jgi:hypothetical protein
LVAVVFAAVRALESLNATGAAVSGVLALLIVLIISGTTETFPSYFSLDTLAVFVLALSVASVPPSDAAPRAGQPFPVGSDRTTAGDA